MIITTGKIRVFGFVVALAALSACVPVNRFHGFAPDARDLAMVQVGQTTRSELVTLFGPPTSDGGVASDTIYYVSSQFVHSGLLPPREVDRTVLAVNFDAADRVSAINRYGLQDGQVVDLDRRVTDDGIRNIGAIAQLLGSFGRINAGALLGDDGADPL